MADVAVVGAGLGGLATAARLAKLGHHVTVLEPGPRPGGLLATLRADGFRWDAIPFQTTIPAVLRDLFRKSGRPIERYVDLQLTQPARRHVFPDGTELDLPTGTRGTQHDAIAAALGPSTAETWSSYVDGLADTWALLRAEVLDQPNGAEHIAERRLAKGLQARTSLDRVLHKAFRDERLRLLAAYPAIRSGARPRDTPGFRAVEAYVERTFGVWRLPGGANELAEALITRMRERSVEVQFGAEVTELMTTGERVVGVRTADGVELRADVAVVTGGWPGRPTAQVVHIGVRGVWEELPTELVLHGDPLVVVTTTGSAPAGHRACTVVVHGGDPSGRKDPLSLLADRTPALADSVVTRQIQPQPEAPRLDVPGPPVRGLFDLSAHPIMGSTVPYVAWQAVHVADALGKA